MTLIARIIADASFHIFFKKHENIDSNSSDYIKLYSKIAECVRGNCLLLAGSGSGGHALGRFEGSVAWTLAGVLR